MKKGECVKGDFFKVRNDVQTKQSFQKKEIHKKGPKKGTNREQHSRTRTKKIEKKHKNKTKKEKSKKRRTDMQKQISMKKCPTEREMNEQVFFDSEKCGRKKNQKMSSPNCWMKTKIFRKHHNRQAKNAKAGETIFQDTEKQDKTRKINRKINVKHVQHTKETDKILFFFVTQQKKKVQQKFTKIQKIVKKGYR